ncbi:MAG: TIGR01212 family radical SAM protein [Lachnospiraceae bacterium]|nr:TIGR01212 family radical SAM protein [Lachnospiraceae bacterium]
MDTALRWGEKPYYSLDYALKQQFGEKIYKLTLHAGCTCPNRDGTLGTGGCIFCSAGGSGEFAASPTLSITEQVAQGKALLSQKRPARKYIAYFQAYTNTYGPLSRLERIFTEALSLPEVVILSIATRPDCLGPEVLALLERLNRQKPVWVELGLQTIHEKTASFIRRGYALPCYTSAVQELHKRGISVITHVILGLPGESQEQMLETVRYVNHLPVSGLKLQLLHILKNTDLATYYEQQPFPVFSLEDYVQTVIACLEICHPHMVIHRLTGDGPKDLLLAPLWSCSKRHVLNTIHSTLHRQNTWQSRRWALTPDLLPQS